MASPSCTQRRLATAAISVFLLLALLCHPGQAQAQFGGPDGAVIEVEFEPLIGNSGQPSLAQILAGLDGTGSSPTKPSSHGKEDELDRAIEGMVASMLSNVGGPPAQALRDGRPIATAGGTRLQDSKSTLPVETFKTAFPGPLILEMDGANGVQNFPFQGSPDPLVLNMLSDLNSAFSDGVLPIMHSAAAAASDAPGTCQADLKAHCSSAPSQLHCLGQHTEDISDACRKEVGKSVPFVCSGAIDKWCDILQAGILSCLEQHVESLEVGCKDSVLATRNIIHTANTQKASVVNKTDGKKKVVMPLAGPPKSSAIVDQMQALLQARTPWPTRYFLYGAAACAIAAVLINHYLSSPSGSRWSRLLQAEACGSWTRRLGFHSKDDGSSMPLVRIEMPKSTDV